METNFRGKIVKSICLLKTFTNNMNMQVDKLFVKMHT